MLSDIGIVFVSMWLGISLFYTITITPAAFRRIPRDKVGDFLGETFPNYYRWGMLLFSLSCLSFMITQRFLPLFLSIISLIFIILAELLRGKIRKVANEIREKPEDENLKIYFFNLHRISAYLNFTVIFSAALIIILYTFNL